VLLRSPALHKQHVQHAQQHCGAHCLLIQFSGSRQCPDPRLRHGPDAYLVTLLDFCVAEAGSGEAPASNVVVLAHQVAQFEVAYTGFQVEDEVLQMVYNVTPEVAVPTAPRCAVAVVVQTQDIHANCYCKWCIEVPVGEMLVVNRMAVGYRPQLALQQEEGCVTSCGFLALGRCLSEHLWHFPRLQALRLSRGCKLQQGSDYGFGSFDQRCCDQRSGRCRWLAVQVR
jgi:hypothetical protein